MKNKKFLLICFTSIMLASFLLAGCGCLMPYYYEIVKPDNP